MWRLLLLLLFCLSAAARQETDPEEAPTHPARQNQILRDYFLRQYLDAKRVRPLLPSQSPPPSEKLPDPFVDRYVDKRIDHFIEELRRSMSQIEEELEAVRRAGSALAEDRSSESLLRRLKDSLDPLADHLGDLHKTLSIILVELKSKADFEPQVGKGPQNPGFAKEIEYISQQYSQAAREISDYFFEPSFTVSVNQMKGENMLIRLNWAQKMAKELRKAL